MRASIALHRCLDQSLRTLLAQENDEGKENTLYYLSTQVVQEERHPPIERCVWL